MNKNFEALQKAEEENAELKARAAEIEKKLQSCVSEYIKLAAEYGITLETSDFNPAGETLSDEDLAKAAGGSDDEEYLENARKEREAMAKLGFL